MSRRKPTQRTRTEDKSMEQNVNGQEEEIIATEDIPAAQAEEDSSVVFTDKTDNTGDRDVPVIEELQPENMTILEPEPEEKKLVAESLVEEITTPQPTPLVNTVQNLASDSKVPSWEQTDHTNTLYGVIGNVLTGYEQTMKAKMPVNKTVGAQRQTELYQIIVRVAQSRTHFKTNWELILSHFHENPTGCYSANYVMRFLDSMQVTKNDITLFTRLLNLIIFTADPLKIAENLRRVSIEKTLSTVSSPVIRANITGYYRNFVS